MEKNKLTIEWYSILRDIVRNIWIVVLCVLIGLMGIYIANYSVYKPEYTSNATLVVNPKGNKNNASAQISLLVSNEMANVLTNIFSQPTMKEKAAAHLERTSFDGEVSATVMGETNFINVKVTSSDPQNSYELLSAVLAVYPEISKNIFSNAQIYIVTPPTMPSGPSNAISSENKGLVLAACVTLSLTAIIALSIARDTVKDESTFTSKVDAKLLGNIMHEDKDMTFKDLMKKRKKGLLIHSNGYISLRFIENFHKIAAKLEYMKRQSGAKVYAVTSVAENEGKSTCAANLAVSLADRGNKVALIDFDCKKPALHKIFNEEYIEESELANVFSGEIGKDELEMRSYKKIPLSLLINTKAYPEFNKWIENGNVKAFVDEIRNDFDFIIIDTAPISLDSAVTNIIGMVDKTILVVRTDVVAIPAINDAVTTVNTIANNLAGCILNDVHNKFMPFTFSGDDLSNYYGIGYGKYGKYGKYGGYGNYGHYGSYGYHHQHRHVKEADTEQSAEV